MGAFAFADAAEVEAQRGKTAVECGADDRADDVVPHVAAVLRVRMADDDAGERAGAIGRVEEAFERDVAAGDLDVAASDHVHSGASGFVMARRIVARAIS